MTRIDIPSPGETVYYGEPGKALVILIHDWYGRLPWLESFAIALVREGFQVAVPDFYGGVATKDAATARELLEDREVQECRAIVDDIIDQARANGTVKIGGVGFSFGGWFALTHAQLGELDAVVAYYASLDEKHHTLIPCPVLLQYAEVDEWEHSGSAGAFFDRLRGDGTPLTHFSYLDTEHYFANLSIARTARPQAAALALARTSAFLSAHLLDD